MVDELRTLALCLKELQLRERFGGILDLKKTLFDKKNQTIQGLEKIPLPLIPLR